MDIRKLIKLDYISIKPYFTLKNLLIMTILAFVYTKLMNSPSMIISITMIFAMLFSSYPFLIGENSGIDGLYRIFGINPKDVVIGRFTLAGLIYIATSIIGIIYYILLTLVSDLVFTKEIFLFILTNFLVYGLITSIQYPIFFKYGYTKAKTFAFLPMFIIGILGILGGFLIEDLDSVFNFIDSHIELFLGISIIVVIIVILLSIILSIKFYKRRDF
ncbi:ABC-2 transporter permease [Anaerococcus marasmi]|uniref:ABC-2 transporter permease n=1 Tax=Anaerococcus marasmi TaxID=2057797 RepID=UPI000CF98922|nr:ABC-2 transporter permease [Anaerococcus marasmi]